METIKALETHYNGFRFRSRIEARWAVFFDSLGYEYEYEPEGFNLGDGYCYLPDFYLPENNAWIEIKGVGNAITDTEIEKIIRFCNAKCDVLNGGSKFRLLVGGIPFSVSNNYDIGREGILCYDYVSALECKYRPYNQLIDEGEDTSRGLLLPSVWCPKRSRAEIIKGLRKARQARFEYGERG